MIWEHRMYTIKDGMMDEFVALFRDHIVAAREACGFTVAGAWNDPEDNTFVWIVGHPAPDGWEAAHNAYYESAERAALPKEPAEFVASHQTRLLRGVL